MKTKELDNKLWKETVLPELSQVEVHEQSSSRLRKLQMLPQKEEETDQDMIQEDQDGK